jgi:uncharacterized membrane protein YoaK (UPF0700 family)
MVESAEAMALDTNVALRTQTEQMRTTNAGISDVNSTLHRADKLMRDIARRLATDKMIMCMVLVLILAIISIAVLKGVGLLDQKTGLCPATVRLMCVLVEQNASHSHTHGRGPSATHAMV